jgi:hypothetical protein
VNHDDALAASIESVRSASESLSKLKPLLEAPHIARAGDEVIHLLDDVIRHCCIVQRILVHLTEPAPRKPG